jgi:hypothetical protein
LRISYGLCVFCLLGVIESLVSRRNIDLHTAKIRISKASQVAITRNCYPRPSRRNRAWCRSRPPPHRHPR